MIRLRYESGPNPPMNTDAQTAALRLLFALRLWALR